MFPLKNAKEIILKRNNDKTYNVTIKYDIYEPKGIKIVNEIKTNFPKVKINKLNLEVLNNDNNTYGELIVNET